MLNEQAPVSNTHLGIFGGDFIESDGFCAVFVVDCNQNFFIIEINGVHERVDKRFPMAFYVRVEFAEPGQPDVYKRQAERRAGGRLFPETGGTARPSPGGPAAPAPAGRRARPH